MQGIAADKVEALFRKLALHRAIEARRAQIPSEWYVPSTPTKERPFGNQLAFHRSPHITRLLVPGNGWGKTTAMAAEVNEWALHTNRWQQTPRWPLLMLWFVKLRDQFEMLKAQLIEEVFGRTAVWNPTARAFVWPDGSKLWIGAADQREDWQKWQGVPVDLVCFDEAPPRKLYREMQLRRRAKRKTRYIIAATATTSDSWMEPEIYRPWLEHHQALGLTEERALFVQSHPTIFCWSMGGIADNPGADASDLAHYEAVTQAMNPKERKVRLRGGFERWVGDGVFDAAALEAMEAECKALDDRLGPGVVGMFEPMK